MQEIRDWIAGGADVNYADKLGFTALMASAKNGDLKMVKLLVAHGAHINLKDNKHFCALHYATLYNKLNIVKYLVDNGAVITDSIYMTAIHKDHKSISLYFDSLDVMKQILKQMPKEHQEAIRASKRKRDNESKIK